MTPGAIKSIVSAETGVSIALMEGDRRTQVASWARFAAMWLLSTRSGLSTPAIGRLFGDRDHTTVISALRRVEDRRRIDQDYASWLDRLGDEASGLRPEQARPAQPAFRGISVGLLYRITRVTFGFVSNP